MPRNGGWRPDRGECRARISHSRGRRHRRRRHATADRATTATRPATPPSPASRLRRGVGRRPVGERQLRLGMRLGAGGGLTARPAGPREQPFRSTSVVRRGTTERYGRQAAITFLGGRVNGRDAAKWRAGAARPAGAAAGGSESAGHSDRRPRHHRHQAPRVAARPPGGRHRARPPPPEPQLLPLPQQAVYAAGKDPLRPGRHRPPQPATSRPTPTPARSPPAPTSGSRAAARSRGPSAAGPATARRAGRRPGRR